MNKQIDRWLKKNITHSRDSKDDQKVVSFKQKSTQLDKERDQKPQKSSKNDGGKGQKVRVIPIGGLNEVGQNMMAIECGNDMIVIDMGFQFPEEDMLGVDYVLPDFSYIEQNRHKLRGVLITHGHLDHIGAIPYISPRLDNPNFYGTKLTMGLVEKRLEEFGLVKQSKINVVETTDILQLGCFKVGFFRVNHSIPDCVGIAVQTPQGMIVHTGDFKFDFTPADGQLADFDKMVSLGRKGVKLLLSDSTNATKPGHTMSEAVVGDTLDKIIGQAPDRIIIASFASLIGRMQQIFDSAAKHKRKIFVSGRSMINNIQMACDLGYLNYPKGLVNDLRGNKNAAKKSNALILTTGSQGESLAALTRMALDEHRDLKLTDTDTVVFSSSPIVGNERAVYAVVNELTRKGIKVINNKEMDVHTSGHGQQEDLKMMLSLINPEHFMPVHGEYYMRHAHGELAKQQGVDAKNILLADNGSIIELSDRGVHKLKNTLDINYILVDGKGLGDLGAKVLSERQAMAQNGVLVISITVDKNGNLKGDPQIHSHGFIYMGEEKKIMKELTKATKTALQNITQGNKPNDAMASYLKKHLDRKTHDLIERRPLIVPVINQV